MVLRDAAQRDLRGWHFACGAREFSTTVKEGGIIDRCLDSILPASLLKHNQGERKVVSSEPLVGQTMHIKVGKEQLSDPEITEASNHLW